MAIRLGTSHCAPLTHPHCLHLSSNSRHGNPASGGPQDFPKRSRSIPVAISFSDRSQCAFTYGVEEIARRRPPARLPAGRALPLPLETWRPRSQSQQHNPFAPVLPFFPSLPSFCSHSRLLVTWTSTPQDQYSHSSLCLTASRPRPRATPHRIQQLLYPSLLHYPQRDTDRSWPVDEKEASQANSYSYSRSLSPSVPITTTTPRPTPDRAQPRAQQVSLPPSSVILQLAVQLLVSRPETKSSAFRNHPSKKKPTARPVSHHWDRFGSPGTSETTGRRDRHTQVVCVATRENRKRDRAAAAAAAAAAIDLGSSACIFVVKSSFTAFHSIHPAQSQLGSSSSTSSAS